MGMGNARQEKPRLSFWQIWNMSFGFLGIQFGFALQNANASRILRTYGAQVDHLSWFWLAAPVTGMIVQPLIGHYSDKTWNRLGRRKPFFLSGAILASLALAFMPNSSSLAQFMPSLLVGAGTLMIMDASINVSMEPFRALVADNLPDSQRTTGFAVQTFLIGIGAVLGSWLPYILAQYLKIAKTAPDGQVPDNVRFSFYLGALFFIGSILWTVLRTKEYPPEEYERYHGKPKATQHHGLAEIFNDLKNMPKTMRQLGLVQFFSWFALFTMWVFTTDAVSTHVYGLPIADKSSAAYNDAGNWVGILFGIYNGVSAVYALFLPRLARGLGRKSTHAVSLLCGAAGLISMYFIHDKNLLILSMIGVGLAWGSILAMPYVILSSSIPSGKMGIYMGIFNFFITIPQIVNGVVGGPMVKYIYGDQPIYALVLAGVFLLCASVATFYVYDEGALAILQPSGLEGTVPLGVKD